jgi:release factor glutamine methyltransferase
MRLIRLPGVFRPPTDTWMLAGVLRQEIDGRPAEVLDLCTGTGALAIAAAQAGAQATAIDISRRAVANVRLNAALNRVRVKPLRGDLFAPVAGRRFDVIVTNPPYVPAPKEDLPDRGLERAWQAGLDGRVLIDRICAEVAGHLKPGGAVLIVQSTINGEDATRDLLAEQGLEADVPFRERGEFGPLMTRMAPELEERGLIAVGQREEEVVVVRGRNAPSPG